MTTNEFVFFYGGIYSQWYAYNMEVDGVMYNCAEQYMMAMKAKTFNDTASLQKIMSTDDPSYQKALGRKVAGFDPNVWNSVAKNHVIKANLAKFSGSLKQQLLNTGDREIVEASPYDKIWGIGLGMTDARIFDKAKWQGTNWLGECIMEVRETFKEELRSGAW